MRDECKYDQPKTIMANYFKNADIFYECNEAWIEREVMRAHVRQKYSARDSKKEIFKE